MTGQPLIDISQLSPTVTAQLPPSVSGGSPGYVLTINGAGTAVQWAVTNATQIAGIAVSGTPTSGQVLAYNGTNWVGQTVSGTGTVTSVAASTTSTGLTITGSPITGSGTLTLTLNGELQGLAALSTNGFVQRTAAGTYTAAALTSSQITTALGYTPANANASGTVTSVSATSSTGMTITGSPITTTGTLSFTLATELQGLSAPTLTTTTGFVQRTGSGTYAVNNLTSSQITAALTYTPLQTVSVTLTGDVTGTASGSTLSIPATLATVNANTGTWSPTVGTTSYHIPTFTVNGKGLITAAGTVAVTRPVFTSTTQGEVPASGGGTANFLRADGTWQPPTAGSGTVTSVAATVSGNGLTITGSPITTTGTLTLTLGTELQGLSQVGANGFVQRTGAGTYTAAALTSGQVTTALGFTPVSSGTTISVSGGALVGGGPLTSSVVITLDAFNGTPGYVPAPTGPIATLGAITGGTGYTSGTYTGVSLTGGSGTGAQATIVVSGGAVITVTITAAGTGYKILDALSATAASIGGTGSGFSVPVATISGETTQYLRADGAWAAPITLSGTANQITASASSGAVTLSLPSAVVLPGTLAVNGTTSISSGTNTGLSITTSSAGPYAIQLTRSDLTNTIGIYNNAGILQSQAGISAGAGTYYSNNGAQRLMFSDQNDGWLRINQNGNFSNGAYTPGNIRADGSIYYGANAYIRQAAGTLSYGSVFVTGGAVNGYNGYGIYDGGRYPIFMTNNSVVGVYCQGNGWWSWNDDGTNFNVHGNLIATGNVEAYSDASLKADVATITNALDRVDALRGVTYTMKETGKKGIGLIAQEVKEVLPEVVGMAKDSIHTVAYGNIVGLLIEAVKELRQEVASLKQRLEDK